MVLEPILALITLYLSFVFGKFACFPILLRNPLITMLSEGLIYLCFEAYPISFAEQRHMGAVVSTLPFISILVGVLIGCILLASTTRTRLAPNPKEGRVQETRLLLMIAGGVALPVGLFWFAWTSFPSTSPWPQIIASVPIGFSIIVVTLQGMNYIIDCYTINANSAIAAMTFVRSLFGAGFPLFVSYLHP